MHRFDEILRCMGRPIAIVGNAPITNDISSVVDGYETVIRCNRYKEKEPFENGLLGQKITQWCVNAKDKSLANIRPCPAQIIICPWSKGGGRATELWEDRWVLAPCTPWKVLKNDEGKKVQHSVGLALTEQFAHRGILVSLYGIGTGAGTLSNHHDPDLERLRLSELETQGSIIWNR